MYILSLFLEFQCFRSFGHVKFRSFPAFFIPIKFLSFLAFFFRSNSAHSLHFLFRSNSAHFLHFFYRFRSFRSNSAHSGHLLHFFERNLSGLLNLGNDSYFRSLLLRYKYAISIEMRLFLCDILVKSFSLLRKIKFIYKFNILVLLLLNCINIYNANRILVRNQHILKVDMLRYDLFAPKFNLVNKPSSCFPILNNFLDIFNFHAPNLKWLVIILEWARMGEKSTFIF